MVQLQKDLKEIEAAGVQLVAISYDSVDILKRFSDGQAEPIGFPLLSDEGSATIRAYGIYNEEANDGIPHPGTYVVDQTGTVRAALFLDEYQDRHTTADLIEAVKSIE